MLKESDKEALFLSTLVNAKTANVLLVDLLVKLTGKSVEEIDLYVNNVKEQINKEIEEELELS